MCASIALKHMCKLRLIESSPKNINNDSLSHVIDSYGWKMWNENNLKVSQWMFSLMQCRKQKQLRKKKNLKMSSIGNCKTKSLTLIALMVMHSIPVHGEVKGVGLVDQIWLSLQDCDNEGEIIKLFRLTCKECHY